VSLNRAPIRLDLPADGDAAAVAAAAALHMGVIKESRPFKTAFTRKQWLADRTTLQAAQQDT
jgi:hypothetical protein